MVVVNGYADRDDLKEWVEVDAGDTELDNLLDKAINAASRGIDNYTKRHFYQIVQTRKFTPRSPVLVRFGTWDDLASVGEIRVDDDDDGIAEVVLDVSDYTSLPVNRQGAEELPIRGIFANGVATFPTGGKRPARVEIDGDPWGWPAIPDAVHEASLIQGARLLKRRKSPEGVVGLNMFGTVRMGRLDPDVKRMVKPYRLRTVG